MIKKYKNFLKPILIVLLTNALIYFLIKYLAFTPHLIIPKTNFPLIKEFVYIYNSWYPFILISSFIIYNNDPKKFQKLIITLIISILLANITYIIYPTIINRPIIEIHNITDIILYLTYYFDTPALNCMPSTHCIFCFIIIYYTLTTKKIKNVNKLLIITYLMLIILSTLLINQHLLIDIITALIYSIISLLITKYLFTKIYKRASKLLF